MVKGHIWQCGQGPPFGIGSIVLTFDFDGRINDGEVGDCDGAASRVAVNLGRLFTEHLAEYILQCSYLIGSKRSDAFF